MDRLEQVVQIIAEDQVSLQKLIAERATEAQRDFDRVAKQFARRHRSRSSHRIDQRIVKLVVAMGEFISRQNGHKK